jgi:hypothetical protein
MDMPSIESNGNRLSSQTLNILDKQRIIEKLIENSESHKSLSKLLGDDLIEADVSFLENKTKLTSLRKKSWMPVRGTSHVDLEIVENTDSEDSSNPPNSS